MKKTFLLIALVSIGGCAKVKTLTTPNGNTGYYISCNGMAVGMDVCYKKAGNICPSGYSIIDGENKGGLVVMPTYIGGVSRKGIIIECKT